MSTYTYGAAPSLSLDQLSDWLWGQETAIGPVIAIGNNGHSTAATFMWDAGGPMVRATIQNAAAAAPAASAKVCQGAVFAEGELVEIVIYRTA